MRALLPCLALLLCACGGIPRDPEGTSERVAAQRRFRVGMVDGARDDRLARALLTRVRATTGAMPVIARGPLEPLLLQLEAGELDLVVGGRFAADTPWATRVALGPKLDERDAGGVKTSLRHAARNGENGWVMLVDREARALAGEAR